MKIVIVLIVIAVLGVGAYIVLGGAADVEEALAPTTEQQNTTETPTPTQGATVVTYTDTGFSPASVTVSVGDTVRFVNSGTRDMWVGADEHPTHTEYDGTSKDEHCPNTTGAFDQCARSGPGTSWEFTFTKAGSFGYHNHAESDHVGTVVVN